MFYSRVVRLVAYLTVFSEKVSTEIILGRIYSEEGIAWVCDNVSFLLLFALVIIVWSENIDTASFSRFIIIPGWWSQIKRSKKPV